MCVDVDDNLQYKPEKCIPISVYQIFLRRYLWSRRCVFAAGRLGSVIVGYRLMAVSDQFRYAECMQNFSKESATAVLPAHPRCFGCGPANSIGLHLEFTSDHGNGVVCETVIPDVFESYPGYLHGGIIATLLDEAMSKAVRSLGISAMTRQMEVEYPRPVCSGKPIRIEGRVLRNEGRNYWVEANISNARGKTLAISKGHFIQVHAR
jgi:uncharacterized protein (TIGR00369 family)